MTRLGMKSLFTSVQIFCKAERTQIDKKIAKRGCDAVVSVESIPQKTGFPFLDLSGLHQHRVYLQRRLFTLPERGGKVPSVLPAVQ